MRRASNRLPRLTPKEREVLGMAIQDMSVDEMAQALGQPPKLIGRHIQQGIGKLEMWASNVLPSSRHNSTIEDSWGFLNPREAESDIRRLTRQAGHQWACIVVLMMPPDPKIHDMADAILAMSCHVRRCVRQSDIVTKWGDMEWIIFLPSINPDQAEIVVHRLKQGIPRDRSVGIAAWPGSESESFNHVAMRGHRELIRHYVNHNFSSWEPL